MATIREIAELAGVSRGTVDRVLNHRGSVNAATAALVNDIAKKLDYKPKPRRDRPGRTAKDGPDRRRFVRHREIRFLMRYGTAFFLKKKN